MKEYLPFGIQHLHRLIIQLFRHGAQALPYVPPAFLIQFEAHVVF